MKVIKKVTKKEMRETLKNDARVKYASCDRDCPRCRISDGWFFLDNTKSGIRSGYRFAYFLANR